MLFEIDLAVEHFVQQSIHIILQLVKVAAVCSFCCSPYQHCLSCYLKGESPHTGNFTVHYQYPFTVQSTIFLFSNEATTSSLLVFHALCCALSLFSERRVTELWFSYHSQCTGSVLFQNRSLSLFPLLAEDHRAKFNTNNKITGAQNTHFHIHRGLI